ncbi:PIN domain protein [bacterium]|nr:PIN domain protein [bacterium]
MKLMRIYIDTSVVGGYFDEEFMEATRIFFSMLRRKRFVPLISDILAEEIGEAPQQVQDLLAEIIQGGVERIQISDEAVDLTDAYLKTGIVTDKYEDDAMHVALATLVRADVIASWNFRHLVNPSRIRAFSGVNAMQGYGPVVILTPADLNRILEESDEHEDKDS